MTIELLADEGYLAWPLFAAIVFSLLLVLLTDYIWRRVRWPAIRLLIVVLIAWASGIFALYAF